MKTYVLIRERYVSGILFVALAFILAGCRESSITDPGTNPQNPPVQNLSIWQSIQSNSNLSTLEQLLEGTALLETLATSSNLTIFAPSDAAFASLPGGYLEGLTDDQKLNLLKYHVYSGSYPVINEIKREAIPSLHGDPIFIEIGQSFGNLLNNRAKFDSTNINSRNGIVHVIDEVLIPDQMGTLTDNISKRYEYRVFFERLKSAGLKDELRAPGSQTLLTTSDAALEWYETGEGLTFSAEQWKEIMKYHILNVDISVTGPGTRMALPTMAGDSVYLTVNEPGKHDINGNGDPYQFVNATNGKIFISPSLMFPDKYIGVLPLMDKRFYLRTARAAMAVARLTGRLYNSENNGDEEFTIFIPGNEAEGMNSLPSDEVELANILKYHVLLEKLTANQLQDGQTYTTWQGEQITVAKNGDQITLNGTSTVRMADLVGNNGVVHVIDRVLTLPEH